MVIPKANPGILKRGCGMWMWIWMWLCLERESYLRFVNIVRMKKIGRNIVRQKNTKRVVYMAMDQKAREAAGKVDLCCDGGELFVIIIIIMIIIIIIIIYYY